MIFAKQCDFNGQPVYIKISPTTSLCLGLSLVTVVLHRFDVQPSCPSQNSPSFAYVFFSSGFLESASRSLITSPQPLVVSTVQVGSVDDSSGRHTWRAQVTALENECTEETQSMFCCRSDGFWCECQDVCFNCGRDFHFHWQWSR